MQFEDSSIDFSGVEDHRGSGGGGFGGGGLGGGGGLAFGGGGVGVVGLIVYLVFNVLAGGGGDIGLSGLPAGTSGEQRSSASGSDLRTRCVTEAAQQTYTDCRLVKVYNVADDVWSEEFARRGLPYQSPRLRFFSGGTRTSCGSAPSSVGPFYCPADQGIYFDLDFLEQLQRSFGAPGEFAQAYIAAHEFGHHLQTILGTERRVRLAQRSYGGNENVYSVAMELQADCYAGVWSNLATQRGGGIRLREGDIEAALNAAEAVGDDRIQQRSGGTVDPESFSHGSSEQRRAWFTRGLTSGEMEACDTFAAADLRI